MSRSCQSATSCRPASRLERTTRARPLIVSAEIGLRLCGIADEPFWPGLKPSRTSATSVRWRWRSSTATSSHVAATADARPQELGVAVAGDHLRRRHRPQPERVADVALDRRVDVRVRADGAGQLADGDGLAGGPQPGRGPGRAAAPTARPWRRTSSARRGCRGCARSSPCRDGGGRASTTVREQLVGGVEEEVGGVAHRPAQRGVDDVRRRQPVVDPRPGRRRWPSCTTSTKAATSWSVVRSRSATAATNASSTAGARSRQARGVGRRHDAERGVGLGGQQLDLQPAAEAGRVGPHRRHLRASSSARSRPGDASGQHRPAWPENAR